MRSCRLRRLFESALLVDEETSLEIRLDASADIICNLVYTFGCWSMPRDTGHGRWCSFGQGGIVVEELCRGVAMLLVELSARVVQFSCSSQPLW